MRLRRFLQQVIGLHVQCGGEGVQVCCHKLILDALAFSPQPQPPLGIDRLVAWSRMYRGEHHPLDVAGGVLLALLWLAAVTIALRPNADLDGPDSAAESGPVAMRHAPPGPAADPVPPAPASAGARPAQQPGR